MESQMGRRRQCSDQNNQIIQIDRKKKILQRTKDLFQKADSLNNNNVNYFENNQLPTSELGIQLVLNKFRPYISGPDDEKNLIIILNNLGVKYTYDLLKLHFERDLKGIINKVQFLEIQQQLVYEHIQLMSSNAGQSVKQNISFPSAVEHAPWTQSNFVSTMPEFPSRVIKSLEKGTMSNDDQLEIVETLSKYIFDVIKNPGMRECRKYVSYLEKQFPNGFRNKESKFNVEYISKQVVQRIYYLKRKKQQLELKQNGALPQNDCASSKMSKQKKLRFGTHPDRYLPVNPEEGKMFGHQEQMKTYLKSLYLVNYVTKLENIDGIKWNFITWCMQDTYAAQRAMITNSEPINKILEDWPFLGKGVYLKRHFFYLTNINYMVLENCNDDIPFILKFVEAEAEKERKDIDLQMRLKAIIRKKNNKNNKNNYGSFLTIILGCMALLKENFERMFIILDDSNTFDELQSNAKTILTPVVACLGDIWSNPKCFVFVGKQCLWREPVSVYEAIQIMFMSYYVFNIQYPKELAGILQYLQRFMFKIKCEGNRVEKRPSGEIFVPKIFKLVDDYKRYSEKNSSS